VSTVLITGAKRGIGLRLRGNTRPRVPRFLPVAAIQQRPTTSKNLRHHPAVACGSFHLT